VIGITRQRREKGDLFQRCAPDPSTSRVPEAFRQADESETMEDLCLSGGTVRG